MKLKVDKMSRWLLALLAVAFCNFAIAQTTVTGTVTDAETGETLIGANILVVGTSTGTITDFDGTYSLNVPAGATQLEFSYTGYASQTIDIAGRTTIDVAMSAGELLDEVVVVGYGTTTQREVTSAVASIKAEDFNAGNVNDPATLIQGKVAGLSISNVGNDPNGNPAIRLRGLSSFGANTSPLIVIDGVIGADLQTVDPNDIESIDVLKDGSAAAIYGVRASAGVILITTKRGRDGQARLNYRGYVTTESIAAQPETASRDEYVRLVGSSLDYGANTDWVDEVTRTGISNVHNLSIDGGNSGTTYRASVNYRDIQGIGVESGFQQLNGRLSLTQKAINDRLTLKADVTATDRDASYGFNEAFRYAITYNPTAPVMVDEAGANVPAGIRDESNRIFGGYFQSPNFDYFNPKAILDLNDNVGEERSMIVSFRADYELMDGLTVAANYSRQSEDGTFREFYSREDYLRGGAAGDATLKGRARQFSETRNTELFEATVNYENQFGGTGLKLLGGYSYQTFDNQNFFIEGRGLPSNAFEFNNLGVLNDVALGQVQNGSFQENYKVIGFFGRAQLDFNDLIFLSASLRYDGTSRNGDEKWGLFPAVSLGVDLKEALDVAAFDALKFRAGYGVTGSLPGSSYLSLQRFAVANQFPVNGGWIPAIGPVNNPNANLVFERKGELDIGVDFALLDYRLTGTIDYYRRDTRDLLFNAKVPSPPFLFPDLLVNLNQVSLVNSGLELSVGYLMDKGNFSWEPRLVFSTFSTTLEEVTGEDAQFNFGEGGQIFPPASSPGAPGQNDDPMVRIAIGEAVGQLFTREVDMDATMESGQFTYVDRNGDGNINQADYYEAGNGLPNFSLGFNNTFRFGQWDANVFFRGDFGHDLFNMYRNFYEPVQNVTARPIENLVQTEYFLENVGGGLAHSDYYIEDASFLALDNATIGYTFDMGEGSAFNNIRVYLTGQNLFYITNYTGVDPNVRYADPGPTDNGGRINLNPDPLVIGIDRRNNYFRTRSFTFGVNVGF
jgi:iron complex outermembrane receptor protein